MREVFLGARPAGDLVKLLPNVGSDAAQSKMMGIIAYLKSCLYSWLRFQEPTTGSAQEIKERLKNAVVLINDSIKPLSIEVLSPLIQSIEKGVDLSIHKKPQELGVWGRFAPQFLNLLPGITVEKLECRAVDLKIEDANAAKNQFLKFLVHNGSPLTDQRKRVAHLIKERLQNLENYGLPSLKQGKKQEVMNLIDQHFELGFLREHKGVLKVAAAVLGGSLATYALYRSGEHTPSVAQDPSFSLNPIEEVIWSTATSIPLEKRSNFPINFCAARSGESVGVAVGLAALAVFMAGVFWREKTSLTVPGNSIPLDTARTAGSLKGVIENKKEELKKLAEQERRISPLQVEALKDHFLKGDKEGTQQGQQLDRAKGARREETNGTDPVQDFLSEIVGQFKSFLSQEGTSEDNSFDCREVIWSMINAFEQKSDEIKQVVFVLLQLDLTDILFEKEISLINDIPQVVKEGGLEAKKHYCAQLLITFLESHVLRGYKIAKLGKEEGPGFIYSDSVSSVVEKLVPNEDGLRDRVKCFINLWREVIPTPGERLATEGGAQGTRGGGHRPDSPSPYPIAEEQSPDPVRELKYEDGGGLTPYFSEGNTEVSRSSRAGSPRFLESLDEQIEAVKSYYEVDESLTNKGQGLKTLLQPKRQSSGDLVREEEAKDHAETIVHDLENDVFSGQQRVATPPEQSGYIHNGTIQWMVEKFIGDRLMRQMMIAWIESEMRSDKRQFQTEMQDISIQEAASKI